MNEDVKWGNFNMDELFTISSGVRLTKKDMESGSLPFIGATDSNNGITNWVSNTNKSLDSNVLGVNYNGSVGECFYHPYECIFSDDVKRLHLKNHEDNVFIHLFFKTLILKQQSKYAYGYKFNANRMKRQILKVPIDENGNPHWGYMESYMKKVLNKITARKPKHKLNNDITNLRTLEEVEWGSFSIDEIGKVLSGKDIYEQERTNGEIPYITSTALNNGVGYFVGNENETLESNCISVNRNGSVGYAFYHGYAGLYSNDVRKLKINHNNKYTSLFITTVIKKQKDKYGYGLKLGTERLKRQKVMLPVDESGKPDWGFMEQYMKRIENKVLSRSTPKEISMNDKKKVLT